MTGFGRGAAEAGGDRFEVEVRTTNGKHLDISARLPPSLAALEGRVRERIAARIGRGRVLVSVSHQAGPSSIRAEVNAPTVKAVVEALREAGRIAGIEGAPRWSDLLAVPGLLDVRSDPADLDAAWAGLGRALDAALDVHEADRSREGETVAAAVKGHLREVETALDEARGLAAEVPRAAKASLEARLAALLPGAATLDTGRLEAEVALLASRADIAEEIDRLGAHIAAARALLGRDGPAGAELGFLAQEMLREWNTIAAKAGSTALSAVTVGARAAVERIREQAANLE